MHRFGLTDFHETTMDRWIPAVRHKRLCTTSKRWSAPWRVVSAASPAHTTTTTCTHTRLFALSAVHFSANPSEVFADIETFEELESHKNKTKSSETKQTDTHTEQSDKISDCTSNRPTDTATQYRPPEYAVPVRAYYVGGSIDFHGLAKRLPNYPKEFFRECVVVRMTPRIGDLQNNVTVTSVGSPTLHSTLEKKSDADSGDLRDGIHPGARAFSGRKSDRKARKEMGDRDMDALVEFEGAGLEGMNGSGLESLRGSGQGYDSNNPSNNPNTPNTPTLNPRETPRYFVVYKYGSVVFFNMGRREREECLKLVRSFCPKPLPVPCTDDYRVMVRPALQPWAQFEADHVVLKQLDLNNISVIGTVLAQTVALEHHELKVDNMIEIFSSLNKVTYETGEMDISKNKLFKLVAENNNTLTELVTRMRLLGRSDTAWQYAQYDKVWSGLRKDFELEDRFEHLDYKLNLIQTQVKFYLDILQNRKSDTLEWIIIVLISMEICVSLYDMSDKLPW